MVAELTKPGSSADPLEPVSPPGVRIPSRAGQASVNPRPRASAALHDRIVIEDLVAAVIGLALLAYLGYALARPDRF